MPQSAAHYQAEFICLFYTSDLGNEKSVRHMNVRQKLQHSTRGAKVAYSEIHRLVIGVGAKERGKHVLVFGRIYGTGGVYHLAAYAKIF